MEWVEEGRLNNKSATHKRKPKKERLDSKIRIQKLSEEAKILTKGSKEAA